MTKYPDTAAGAQAFIEAAANKTVLSGLEALKAEGGHWTPDPYVRNVWGFFAGDGEVVLIAYLDALGGEGDFEHNEIRLPW
jgi:hypothetical protein